MTIKPKEIWLMPDEVIAGGFEQKPEVFKETYFIHFVEYRAFADALLEIKRLKAKLITLKSDEIPEERKH